MWLPGVLVVVAKQRGVFTVPLVLAFVAGFFLLLGKPYIDANRAAFFKNIFAFDRVTNFADAFFFGPFMTSYYFTFEGGHAVAALIGDILIAFTNLFFLFGAWTNVNSFGSFLKDVRLWPLSFEHRRMESDEVARIMLGSAHIAFTFAPQFHRQFICWYAATLPYLLSRASIKRYFRILMLVAIESLPSLSIANSDPPDFHRTEKFILVLLNLYLLTHSFRLKPQREVKQEIDH